MIKLISFRSRRRRRRRRGRPVNFPSVSFELIGFEQIPRN